jgi:hypothetical protein
MKTIDMNPIQFIEHMEAQGWQSGAAYRLACRNWLAHNQPKVASTKEPSQENLSDNQALLARLSRVRGQLYTIDEHGARYGYTDKAMAEHADLKDQEAAILSKLGVEPKEPEEANGPKGIPFGQHLTCSQCEGACTDHYIASGMVWCPECAEGRIKPI